MANDREAWTRHYDATVRQQEAAETLKQMAASTKPKPSKYRNQPVTIDGRWFQSKAEGERYCVLRARLAAGEIRKLESQPRYVLHTLSPAGEWIEVGSYKPDFRYVDAARGRLVVEDVKSKATRTEAYAMRKRHVEAEYGIVVEEMR